MKLIDAIKINGKPFWIPGAVRSELPNLFIQLGFKKGVEIGVSWGGNIVDYCEAGLEIYGVDPWLDYEDDPYKKIVSIHGGNTIDEVYDIAVERTKNYPNCKLIRKMSMDALDDFGKRSLDFVYIDGNHKFGYVAIDMMKWVDKIKKGGIMAGHDYYSTRKIRKLRQVRHVVDAFVNSYDIENFWVLGRENREPDERYDTEFSWMFFKHW
jgi:hypothetical protein